jgi:hypothetical protein
VEVEAEAEEEEERSRSRFLPMANEVDEVMTNRRLPRSFLALIRSDLDLAAPSGSTSSLERPNERGNELGL